MAPGKMFIEISTFVLLLIQSEATRADQSNLLSLLSNKFHHQDNPVIIILDPSSPVPSPVGLKNRANLDQDVSQTSDEDGPLQLIHAFMIPDAQPKKKSIQHKLKKSTLRPYNRDEKKRKRYRHQKGWKQRVQQKDDKNALRSPIVKKLLRISNSLRCEAKGECQDKCAGKFYGKQVSTCVIQCETKYECDEENDDDNDRCDDVSDCDDSDGHVMSTKGERLVTGEPKFNYKIAIN